MDITTHSIESIIVIKLKGQFNIETASCFVETTEQLISQEKYCHIIDLESCDYISSAGIRALYQLLDKLNKHNGHLMCCAANSNVAHVLSIINMESDIPIYTDAQSALSDMIQYKAHAEIC